MITQVKHLQEALQRFNPDARLKYELDVQGASPATQCIVTTPKRDELESELEKAESKIEELEIDVKDYKEAVVNIKAAITNLDKTDEVRLAVEEILDEAGL